MSTATTAPIRFKNAKIAEGVESGTMSLAELAARLGASYTTIHAQAQAGTLPVPCFRIGSRYRVPIAPVNRLLGIEPAVEAN